MTVDEYKNIKCIAIVIFITRISKVIGTMQILDGIVDIGCEKELF